MTAIASLLCALWFVASPGFTRGLQAYEEGKFDEALQAFTEEETRAEGEASVALFHNRALAALRVGKLLEAEIAAEKAAARGGKGYAATRDFLFGNTAFQRAEWAESEATRPDADPTALDRGILHARKAVDWWRRAAVARPDWPEARRNVARALLKIRELQKKKREAEAKKRKEKEKKKQEKESPPKPPDVPPPPDGQRPPPPRDAQIDVTRSELTPEQVRQLFEKLDGKEKEKREVRQATRRARQGQVEKDW